MYRVLIVDDEPEIVLGLRLKVDWERLGLRIDGEASNGAEALELLDGQPFDIVVTDMNMPGDGRPVAAGGVPRELSGAAAYRHYRV